MSYLDRPRCLFSKGSNEFFIKSGTYSYRDFCDEPLWPFEMLVEIILIDHYHNSDSSKHLSSRNLKFKTIIV